LAHWSFVADNRPNSKFRQIVGPLVADCVSWNKDHNVSTRRNSVGDQYPLCFGGFSYAGHAIDPEDKRRSLSRRKVEIQGTIRASKNVGRQGGMSETAKRIVEVCPTIG
jgi:hypothetical protein